MSEDRIAKLEEWFKLEKELDACGRAMQGLLEKRRQVAAEVAGLSGVPTWTVTPPPVPRKTLERGPMDVEQGPELPTKKRKKKGTKARLVEKIRRLEGDRPSTVLEGRGRDQSQDFQGDPNKT
jgi:hypothetical protein